MSTDYRALCAELLAAVQLYLGLNPEAAETSSNEPVRRLMDAMGATAAALSAPPATAALIDALVKTECALADIAEGEPGTDEGDAVPWWAENRCSDTLAIIRPVMQQHGIRTSEWPPASQPARAALAQPVPEGPTDEEWEALKEHLWNRHQTIGLQGERFVYDRDFDIALDGVRQELARWGRPAVEPVPVAERLPGDQLCWWFEADEDGGYGSNWTLLRIRGSAIGYTHWLYHWALPLPQEGE